MTIPGPRRLLARAHPGRAVAVYLLLLVASNIVQVVNNRVVSAPPQSSRFTTAVAPQTAERETSGPTVSLSAIRFAEAGDRPPIILLHGSPGDATNFRDLGPYLIGDDRPVDALDLPGFGLSEKWVPDYSAKAYARYVLAFMDANRIERAHLVGWSNGGAVALFASDLAPDRIASLALLASIACQETEGSGDYYFEHAKYAVGYAALVALPELVPHFGLLGPRSFRHAFIRNFWDTDQRPIREIMESLETPTLILHGRHDPLVSDWAAERHHELIPTSRLVMTPDSHFLPIMQPEQTAGFILDFVQRHDEPGVPPLTDALIQEERSGQPWFWNLLNEVRSIPYPLASIALAVFAVCRRETATAIAGFFVGHGVLDFGVALVGLFVGRLALRPPVTPRQGRVRRTPATLAWTGVSLLIAQIALSSRTGLDHSGPFTLIYAIIVVSLLLNLLKAIATRRGRRSIANTLRRARHHEWWPAPLLYLTILPSLLRLAIRHRSLTVWTCVNPGIPPGGGIAGEDKVAILDALDPAHALTQRTIRGTRHSERERAAIALLERRELTLPVVVKPVAGERGSGVSIVRTQADLGLALAAFDGPAIVQRYHPGPVELGIFWVRDPKTVGQEDRAGAQGRILAVTRKIFPEIVSDGERTLAEQIETHPRFRMQSRVFARTLRSRWNEVPPEGERVRLSAIGNHARGCRFEDGTDLITPALTETIDRLARTWRAPNAEPFDFGRFDIRCTSEDDARAGRDLAVIELNGVTSEATALYDPSWSPARARALLSEQWSIAFELGAARRSLGARPLGPLGVLRAIVAARTARPLSPRNR